MDSTAVVSSSTPTQEWANQCPGQQRLWKNAEPVSKDQMRAGDLLFFNIAGKMSHVGMYIGDDRFVHAPSTGKVVSVASLRSNYYRKALIRAGRPE